MPTMYHLDKNLKWVGKEMDDNQPKVKINNIPKWWDKDYIFYNLLGPLHKYPIGSNKIKEFCMDVYFKILRSKRYGLISDYYQHFTEVFQREIGTNVVLLVNDYKLGEERLLDAEFRIRYIDIISWILALIQHNKGKTPVGTKTEQILWVKLPSYWFHSNGTGFKSFVYPMFIFELSPYLSGNSNKYIFDKLLLPDDDKWPSTDNWTESKIFQFQKSIAQELRFNNGWVTMDDYLKVLSDAFLEQKYNLIDDYPVLVRLENHPLIREVVLAKKQNRLICKISTFLFGDLLHIQALDEVLQLDILGMFNANIGKWTVPPPYNYAIAALIASIYRDLVTVEEKEIGTRRVAGRHKPDLKTKKVDPLEPKLYTTSWQYIPRRQYIYNRPNDESYMDREPLSEGDKHRQQAIRKWHMVCGHIRRFHNNPEFMAKGEKQDEALADGIILRTGETYVKPHARGVGALEELGEIDINSIPHYMRRKIK